MKNFNNHDFRGDVPPNFEPGGGGVPVGDAYEGINFLENQTSSIYWLISSFKNTSGMVKGNAIFAVGTINFASGVKLIFL